MYKYCTVVLYIMTHYKVIFTEVQTPTWEGAINEGKQANHCKVQRHSAVICAKTAEPIEVPFGLRSRSGRPWSILVDRGATVKYRHFLP